MSTSEVSKVIQSIAKKQVAFTVKEEKLLKQLVDLVDHAKEGHLEFADIAEQFRKKGLNVSERDVAQVFKLSDHHKKSLGLSGQPAVGVRDDEDLRAKAELAIRAYDRNRDGMVSKAEMAIVSGKKLSKEQIDRCFEINDKDKDGYLNCQEMEEMLKRRKEALKKSKEGGKL